MAVISVRITNGFMILSHEHFRDAPYLTPDQIAEHEAWRKTRLWTCNAKFVNWAQLWPGRLIT